MYQAEIRRIQLFSQHFCDDGFLGEANRDSDIEYDFGICSIQMLEVVCLPCTALFINST